MRYIELALDHQAIGCGWRRFIDLTGERAKDATLFYLPTLTQIKVPRETLRYAKVVPMNKALARTLKSRLRRNLKDHQRLGLRAPRAQVKVAIEKITEETGV